MSKQEILGFNKAVEKSNELGSLTIEISISLELERHWKAKLNAVVVLCKKSQGYWKVIHILLLDTMIHKMWQLKFQCLIDFNQRIMTRISTLNWYEYGINFLR